MKITNQTLPGLMAGKENFVEIYKQFADAKLREARLTPKLSRPRLIEVRGAWRNDLTRVQEHEPNLSQGLDHFKQAAHLVFWLRRMSPLVEAHDDYDNIADAQGYPLTDSEKSFRKILLPYANEFLAFDFGLQIVRFYENGKQTSTQKINATEIPADYYKTVCHFLKFKTVSPHAINLIYRSLFV